MLPARQTSLSRTLDKRWISYLVKAFIVLGLFHLGIRMAPTLEPLPFILF